MVFDVVGDADKPDGGGGQQQRADGAVDGAVCDIEQFVGGGFALESLVKARHGVVVGV
jgi:hypothetical protein